ncbi:MAG: hypothetical protein HY800_03850 [Ignavibacteriales bacterium]|nr:hypothetical protein [Ignavibacteriales bacterium]
MLRKGGWFFVEMGYDQRAEVVQIFEQADYTNVEVFRDYSGIERVVKAQMN